ncbi:MAG: ABC transporter permease [Streptosporangiales bacterium]
MTAVTAPLRTGATYSPLAGTGTLIRFILRRDRVRIPVWVAALTLATVSTATSFPGLYKTAAERQARAALLQDNPTGIAFTGPGYGVEHYTFGAMLANEMLGFIAVFAALMSVLLVVRHTRTEEETGRTELVRATVTGRHAHLAAALTVVCGVNVVLGLLIALALGGSGVASLTWVGSLAFGAAVASVGVVFAGIAAIAAQLTEHARTAAGMAGLVIGVAFVLRAVGDIGDGVASWISPIGWAQATRAYVDERWWPLGLAAVVAVAFAVAAVMLSARRDAGVGMLAQRPGPARASAVLGRSLGLALRLQRGALIGWATALFAFGAVYGSLIDALEKFINDNAAIRQAIGGQGGSAVDSFLALIIGMLAAVSAIYAVQSVSRLRTEEAAGRVEALWGTALSRIRWVAGHLAVAGIGSALVLALTGLGLGASAAVAGGDPDLLPTMLGAALAYVPAVWLTVGVTVALAGLLPRLVTLAWAVPVYALIVGMFGGLLQFPDWAIDLSPFEQVPQLPGAELTWTPLIALTGIAVALTALGLLGYRRRDLQVS